MSVLELKDIEFAYGNEQLYLKASMRLFEGEHAVLVGPNGSGKTTLLKLMEKGLRPDRGFVEWIPHKKIGYLDQYAKIDGNLIVKSYLYDAFLPLFEKEKQMQELYERVATVSPHEQEKLLIRASSLGEALIEADFYAIKSKIGNIIHGLGLQMDILEVPIKHLSGGMRAKIILGKLLLEEADILLLDEPTNFLDVKHIDWLSKFLNSYPKAFIVVSHHEGFLRSIAQTVFALESKQITRYKGDFDFYIKERELRYAQQEKAFETQQKFINKTEDFIKKNIVRATTTKRAQSRRKMLEKLERVTPPKQSRTYKFQFPIGKSTGRDVLVCENLEIGYQDSLIEPLNMTIMKEEKVVITGKNGIGKSSFIKTIMDIIPEIEGNFKWIDTAEIAYFAQESNLEKGLTPFQIVHHEYPHFDRKDVMSLLGNHGINYEMAQRKIGTLSGGEQTKVRLALLRHKKGNVLILDEPTNHLDVEAKDALKAALMKYQGTLILVSHEKDFYQDVCDYEISLFANEE
jgi:ATPase subunit of ABC transporter with duplicated ATPase domains